MHLSLTVSRISVGCLLVVRFRAHNVEKYVSKINRHIFLANLLKTRTLFEIPNERVNEQQRETIETPRRNLSLFLAIQGKLSSLLGQMFIKLSNGRAKRLPAI